MSTTPSYDAAEDDQDDTEARVNSGSSKSGQGFWNSIKSGFNDVLEGDEEENQDDSNNMFSSYPSKSGKSKSSKFGGKSGDRWNTKSIRNKVSSSMSAINPKVTSTLRIRSLVSDDLMPPCCLWAFFSVVHCRIVISSQLWVSLVLHPSARSPLKSMSVTFHVLCKVWLALENYPLRDLFRIKRLCWKLSLDNVVNLVWNYMSAVHERQLARSTTVAWWDF